MSATTLARQKSLLYEFQNLPEASSPFPSTWYVGLSTSMIDEDGNNAIEPPTLANYTRVALPRGTTKWDYDAAAGVISNKQEIIFNLSSDNWGAIQEVFIASGSTPNPGVSDIWYHFVLPTSIPISGNMLYKIPAKVLEISMYRG